VAGGACDGRGRAVTDDGGRRSRAGASEREAAARSRPTSTGKGSRLLVLALSQGHMHARVRSSRRLEPVHLLPDEACPLPLLKLETEPSDARPVLAAAERRRLPFGAPEDVSPDRHEHLAGLLTVGGEQPRRGHVEQGADERRRRLKVGERRPEDGRKPRPAGAEPEGSGDERWREGRVGRVTGRRRREERGRGQDADDRGIEGEDTGLPVRVLGRRLLRAGQVTEQLAVLRLGLVLCGGAENGGQEEVSDTMP